MALRHVDTDNGSLRLRWAKGGDLSLRAYECLEAISERFCVSTRSSELTFVLEGEMAISMGPAAQTVRIVPGGYGLVMRGTPHRFSMTAGAKVLVVDVPARIGTPLSLSRQTRRLSLRELGLVEGVWEELLEWCPSRLSDARSRLGVHVHGLSTLELERVHNTRRMLAAKTELEDAYLQPVDLGSLASRLRMDRFYLARSFKRTFGASPRAYLQHLRLEHVIWSVLDNGSGDLTRAAADSGYGDYATFSRRVRSRLGSPPSRLVTA